MFLTAHIAMMAWSAVRIDDRALSADEVTRLDGLRDSASRWSADPAESGGGWWDSVVLNARSLEDGFVLGSEFITILLMGGGLFLLGAKLFRTGILDDRGRRMRLWLIAIGFGVALPVDYLLARTSVLPALSGFSRYGAAAVVALGILALVGEYYCRRQRVGLAGRLLSYVGRMALSFSWAWLRRFPRGPFELLWNWGYRKLARE